MTIPLPAHLYNDTTWTGLAFGVSLEVDAIGSALLDIEDSEASYNLLCHLDAGPECVDECLIVYSQTKEKLKMIQQGGINLLSWIPRESFPDTLNQWGWIEASFVIDCLGFTVRKCGLGLLYQHNEEEFKEIIKRTKVQFPMSQANS